MAMTRFPRLLRNLMQLVCTLLMLLVDGSRYFLLCLRLRACLKIPSCQPRETTMDHDVPPCHGPTLSLLSPPCVHAPQWVQAVANIRSPAKRASMPCSPAYASSLYPCDLTDAE
jgi:hypothetical protein